MKGRRDVFPLVRGRTGGHPGFSRTAMTVEPVTRVPDAVGASDALIGTHAMAARGRVRQD